jgi:single-stranded DNA-binding protein
MQIFCNAATQPVRKESKATGKGYFEFRAAESHRGVDAEPTWYTVRCMKDVDPGLAKGDFVKVTGRLKTDFYLSREGKPTGTLLILAFEAAKIAKPVATAAPTTAGEAAPASKPKATEAPAAQEAPTVARSLRHEPQPMLVDWTD